MEFDAFALATTATVNGRCLKELLSTIERENVRYVGIIATDARDKVFLISSVRARCPDVQIFTTSADVLLTLPQYAYYLKGTFIATTYALVQENQSWTAPLVPGSPDRLRHAFPNNAAQGHFNAVLALRGQPERLIEYLPPNFEGLAEEVTIRPPIRITMIGAGGEFVPLRCYTTSEAQRESLSYLWPEQEKKTAPVQMELHSPGTAALALTSLLLFCAVIVGYAIGWRSPLLFWRLQTPLNPWDWLEGIGYRTICLLALLIFLAPVACLCSMAAAGCSVGDERTTSLVSAGIHARCLFTALTWFAVLSLGCLLFLSHGPRTAASQGGLVGWKPVLLVGAVLLILAGLLTWFMVRQSLTSERALFFARWTNFSGGASPLMPLLFMAAMFFCWGFFQLKRAYLAERFTTPLPFPGDFTNVPVISTRLPLGRFQALDQALTGEFQHSLQFLRQRWRGIAIVCLLVLIAALRLWSLYLFIPEHPFWSCLFFLGFTFGFLLIALSFLRFLLCWSYLKHLLNQLVLLPMAVSFDRLPHKVKQLFGTYMYSQRPHFSHLSVPIHELRLLQRETEEILEKCTPTARERAALRNLCRDVDDVETAYACLVPGDAATSREFRYRLSRICQQLVPLLGWLWQGRPTEEAFGHGSEDHALRQREEKPAEREEPLRRWMVLAEDLLATYTLLYVGQFFVQLRNQVASLILCVVLLILGSTAYPFNIANFILLAVLALLALIIGGVIFILYEINVNELVSRVTGTTPNRFTPDAWFLSSLVTYVVPALVVVSIQLSGSFRYLLEPILRVFK